MCSLLPHSRGIHLLGLSVIENWAEGFAGEMWSPASRVLFDASELAWLFSFNSFFPVPLFPSLEESNSHLMQNSGLQSPPQVAVGAMSMQAKFPSGLNIPYSLFCPDGAVRGCS